MKYFMSIVMVLSVGCQTMNRPPVHGNLEVEHVSMPTAAVHAHPNSSGLPDDLCDTLPQHGPCSMACNPSDLSFNYGTSGECVEFYCETMVVPFTLVSCTP